MLYKCNLTATTTKPGLLVFICCCLSPPISVLPLCLFSLDILGFNHNLLSFLSYPYYRHFLWERDNNSVVKDIISVQEVSGSVPGMLRWGWKDLYMKPWTLAAACQCAQYWALWMKVWYKATLYAPNIQTWLVPCVIKESQETLPRLLLAWFSYTKRSVFGSQRFGLKKSNSVPLGGGGDEMCLTSQMFWSPEAGLFSATMAF